MDLVSFFHEFEQFGVLKRFQRDLLRLTGLCFDFMDTQARSSRHLRTFRQFTPFCKFINRTSAGRRNCEACTRRAVDKCLAIKKTVISRCHLGLVDIYIPVIAHERIIGVFSTGQLIFRKPNPRDTQALRRRVNALGLDPQPATALYLKVPIVNRRQVAAVIDLVELLIETVLSAERETLSLAVGRQQDPIIQAREFIERHYRRPIALADVASYVHLSPSRLAHRFKDRLDTTVTAYLNDVRIHWAKYFLANTTSRSGEIAARVGFENLSHFNHRFKTSAGYPPLAYRKIAQ